MSSVLAIDAAWTQHEPSGVALLDDASGDCACVALAPSYESFIEQTRGVSTDWEIARFRGCCPDLNALLDAARDLLGGRYPDLVTVDMPISNVPIIGRRIADDQISRTFGGRGCSAHTPSITRPGPIGASLTNSLRSRGYPLATMGAATTASRRVIEVYPHPALLTLLNEDFSVSGRSKPASAGRLKTSHFEETPIRRLGSRAIPLPQELSHGESAQDGHQRVHSYTAPPRLVPTPHRRRVGHQPRDRRPSPATG
jgi:predicted RNase H-like nuclease